MIGDDFDFGNRVETDLKPCLEVIPFATGSPTTKRPANSQTQDRRLEPPPPSFVSTTSTMTSDAVPHYLLLAAGSLLFAVLGMRHI